MMSNPDKLKESTQKRLTAQVNNGAAHTELAKLDEFIAKAYGAGSLDFEQFRDLAKDVKKRKEGYISQRVELNKKLTQESLENIEVDKIVFEAEKVITEGGGLVKVKGRLPLFTLNMGYESISRDTHSTIPSIKFKFFFIAKAPRKERVIVQRDALGRIIHSKPPPISI